MTFLDLIDHEPSLTVDPCDLPLAVTLGEHRLRVRRLGSLARVSMDC